MNILRLPVIPLRGLSVFPKMLLNFDVERPRSIAALEEAAVARKVFLVAQKDMTKETPLDTDLYRIGTVCHIKQTLRMPGGGHKILVEGVSRARLRGLYGGAAYTEAELDIIEEGQPRITAGIEALIRKCVDLFDTYASISGNIPKEIVISAFAMTQPGVIADYITQNTYFSPKDKQCILETLKPVKRLETVCQTLAREIEVLGIERQIDMRLRTRLEGQQRDHILREHLRVIQKELGEHEDNEFEEYRDRILALALQKDIEEKLLKEVGKLEKQQFGSAEATVLRNYLDLVLELPWNTRTRERIDIIRARRILDQDHFGLERVKERIIEFLSVKQLSGSRKGMILCLVGPPGVGKTSIAVSIARAVNRKLARLSLGGVHDEAEIRGHRKTYIGAMPGRIITALIASGSRNPLMLLDEVDKLGGDYRGDPSSALLEALDPEQNSAFRDHFLEIPFDLSDTLFITTANTTQTIPKPLLDRMEVIELSSYTDMEKLEIAKRHLIPKQRRAHGLSARQLKISDGAVLEIISGYTREAGVRLLERELAAVCRKTAAKIVAGGITAASVTEGQLEAYLGVRKYKPERRAVSDEAGLVKGLAWTSAGGETLDIEANAVPGTGRLELTGNLGDVMKESARAALTYIRSRTERFGIDPDFHKNRDIHIHFPEGAVPKDGPSAGMAIACALISSLTGAPARRDIAMTGEITLRGRILRIGGLKEKTMAALRAGITTVVMPGENEPDLEDIDPTVRRALNFIMTDHIDGVIDTILDFPVSTAPAYPAFTGAREYTDGAAISQ